MQETTAIPQRWIYFLLFVLSFVLYGNSIRNGYCLDDNFVVTDNAYVQQGLAGINSILSSPYAQYGRSTLDYRPIASVTFAIEHQFFNDDPHISHFINILLYAVSLILIYRVLVSIFQLQRTHPLLPLLITLLYAVHPLHTEVVDSLKNRDELLSMLFGWSFLLAAHSFFKGAEHRKRKAVFSVIFLALCLMSKIAGIVFVGFFLLIALFRNVFKGNKWNAVFALFCILISIQGMYRAFSGLHRTINSFENPLQQNKDMLIAAGTALRILLYHLKMLVFPSPLSFYYGYNVFPLNGMGDIRALLSLLIHAVLLVYGIKLFVKKDILGLAILFYFAAVFPYSNILIPYTGMFSERALLISSLWFILVCGILLYRLFVKYKKQENASFNKAILFGIIAVFFMYSWMTIRRNFLWKDNLTLMSHDIRHLDHSLFANYIFANNLKSASDHAQDTAEARSLALKAVRYYKRTIEIVPTYPEFSYKLATTYQYNLKDKDNAEELYKKTIGLDSFYAPAQYELGKLYFEKGDFRMSYRYLGNAFAINPTDTLAMYLFSQSAASVGDMPTCYRVNKKFIEQYPDMQVPYVNMGIYYSKISKDDSAVIYFEKAIKMGYREPQLLRQMVIYYDKKENKDKAKFYQDMLKPE